MNLVDGLVKEMARVRDEVMPAYLEIGSAGQFALIMMRADLDAATKALAEGDAIACVRLYKALHGYST